MQSGCRFCSGRRQISIGGDINSSRRTTNPAQPTRAETLVRSEGSDAPLADSIGDGLAAGQSWPPSRCLATSISSVMSNTEPPRTICSRVRFSWTVLTRGTSRRRLGVQGIASWRRLPPDAGGDVCAVGCRLCRQPPARGMVPCYRGGASGLVIRGTAGPLPSPCTPQLRIAGHLAPYRHAEPPQYRG